MNPYAQAAADMAAGSPVNPYADAAAGMVDEQRTTVRRNIMGAAANDPMAAASAARLSRETGLPADVVQRNLPAVQKRIAMDRVEADTADTPTLRGRYADPTFASVAHDDSRALSRLERVIGRSTAYLMGATPTGGIVGDIAAGYYRASAGTAGAFRAASETAAIPLDVLERFPSIGGNPLRRLAEGFGSIAQQSEDAAQRRTAPATGVISGGVSSGVQSAVQSLLMMPLGLIPGGQGAALTGMAASSGGGSYQRAREQGIPQGQALAYGASDAVIEYATERLPLSRLLGDLKAGTPALQMVTRQIAAEVPGEQVATVLQDMNEWAVLNPDKPFADYLRERPAAAAQTLIATVVGAGGNVAVMKTLQTAIDHAVGDTNRARTAVADAQELQQAIQAADASALKSRDPETFADFVRGVNPDTVFYVAPEHLAGVDLSAVPGVAAQVAEAQATGGDVQVVLAELLAHLPGEQLLPHLRTAPEAMTLTEAQQHDGIGQVVGELATGPVEGALLRTPEAAGMEPDTWAAYQTAAADAAETAIMERDARQQRNLQWLTNAKNEAARQLGQEVEATRAAIETQVRDEVAGMPVYAAQAAMRTHADRIPTASGVEADLLAERFGFTSGDEMLQAVRNAEPVDDLVARLTEERLLDQRPDIADAIARERSAEAMVADRARERFLAAEAAALARAVGNRVLLEEEARRYAERSIAGRAVRNAMPGQFKAAAGRAERASADAFRRGDTALSAKWKTSQVLQSALQTQARVARDEITQALRQFKRMQRDAPGRDGNLANTARAILAQYGLAPADKTPGDYLEQVERYDPELFQDLRTLMEGLPAPVADHRDMTVGDFRTVRDRVQAIWTLARSTREIEIDGQKMEIEQAAALMAERLAAEPAAKREQMVGRNDRLDLRMRLAGMRAALRRVEFWTDARDGGDKAGPFRRFLWQPVAEAVTRYRTQRNEYVAKFQALLKTIEPTLKPGKIAAPELADGMVFADRSALLHALLHLGNDSNRRKLLLGYGWATQNEDGTLDTSRWDAFMERMHFEKRITKADWQFVQATWDLMDAMKPSAQAAHYRMFGSHFDEITAEPVETPFGQFRGGYTPAITDRLVVPESRSHGAMDDLLASQSSAMFPAVGRGFTRSRVENYTRPLALDLRLLPAHIDAVAKFAQLGPVLRDTARLVMRNRTFRDAMNAVDPMAVESTLAPWLKRTSMQTLTKAPETVADRAVAKIATTVRNRTGLLLMAANVVNTLQQITTLSTAALLVKPKHLATGLLEFMHSPTASARAISELSPWMQQRADTGARDIEQSIEEMLTNPSARQRAEQFANRHGYFLQQAAQNFLDRVVWLGAYRQAASEGLSDADQVRAADSAVRMSQGSFAPEDSANVEHAGAFTRLFLAFYSFFGGQANLIATEAQNALRETTALRRAARLAQVYLLGFAIPAFVGDVIVQGLRGNLGDDDEDGDELSAQLLEVFFLSQARYALAALPVVGQVGNAALGQLTPERYDDRIGASPVYSAAEAAVRAPFSVYRALEDDRNPRQAVRDALTALSLLTGIPMGPLIRPLGHLADDEADEVTVRGLVTGR